MNNGVEGGLYNVKAQFEPEAQKELGKKLTEELLVAWLLEKRLVAAGHRVERECPLPQFWREV